MMTNRFEIAKSLFVSLFGVTMYFEISGNKCAHQISPGSSLVVSSIPLWKAAAIDSVVIFVILGKRTDSRSGIELFFYGADYCKGLIGREHRIRKRYSINLIWPDAVVFGVSVDNIIQALFFRIPKGAAERFLYAVCKLKICLVVFAVVSG